jgi:hypothetical protein
MRTTTAHLIHTLQRHIQCFTPMNMVSRLESKKTFLFVNDYRISSRKSSLARQILRHKCHRCIPCSHRRNIKVPLPSPSPPISQLTNPSLKWMERLPKRALHRLLDRNKQNNKRHHDPLFLQRHSRIRKRPLRNPRPHG